MWPTSNSARAARATWRRRYTQERPSARTLAVEPRPELDTEKWSPTAPDWIGPWSCLLSVGGSSACTSLMHGPLLHCPAPRLDDVVAGDRVPFPDVAGRRNDVAAWSKRVGAPFPEPASGGRQGRGKIRVELSDAGETTPPP